MTWLWDVGIVVWFWIEALACLIILPSFLRHECSLDALEEKICWKFRTVNFLLGICCKAAAIMLFWILWHEASSDSVVLVVEEALLAWKLDVTWLAKACQ